MTRKAFEKIAEGLEEAIAVARGEAEPARMHVPPEIDVRALRRRLSMTQESFARCYGFTVSQVRDWEQGRNRPRDAARTYLMLIQSAPQDVRALLDTARSRSAA